MPRRLVATAVALVVAGCGGGSQSLTAWCAIVADGAVVALDAPDASERWSDLERAAPSDVRPDVERLRVAADQVAGVDDADLGAAALLVLNPLVVDAHRRVVREIGSRCRIDVSTLSVIDQR